MDSPQYQALWKLQEKRDAVATMMPRSTIVERDKEPCWACCSADMGISAAVALEAGGGLLSDKQSGIQGKSKANGIMQNNCQQ